MTVRIPLILGTVREGNRSSTLARYVHAKLASHAGVESPFIDPAKLPLGNLVAREWEMKERPAWVDEFVRTIADADGFVIVSPEYNHAMPGALKNVLDFIEDEWHHKPFAICSTGGVSGGIRMTEQLRLVLLALRAFPLHSTLHVQFIARAFDAAGQPTDPKLPERVDRFVEAIAKAAVDFRGYRALQPKPEG